MGIGWGGERRGKGNRRRRRFERNEWKEGWNGMKEMGGRKV